MRGGSPLGRWEVKDCSNFKAMSLCKMPVKTWDKIELERRWPFRKCYVDWESKSGLASCFKVMSRLSVYSFGPCIPSLIPKIFFLKCLVQSLSIASLSPYVYIPNNSKY